VGEEVVDSYRLTFDPYLQWDVVAYRIVELQLPLLGELHDR
jgi:hypothetical protein